MWISDSKLYRKSPDFLYLTENTGTNYSTENLNNTYNLINPVTSTTFYLTKYIFDLKYNLTYLFDDAEVFLDVINISKNNVILPEKFKYDIELEKSVYIDRKNIFQEELPVICEIDTVNNPSLTIKYEITISNVRYLQQMYPILNNSNLVSIKYTNNSITKAEIDSVYLNNHVFNDGEDIFYFELEQSLTSFIFGNTLTIEKYLLLQITQEIDSIIDNINYLGINYVRKNSYLDIVPYSFIAESGTLILIQNYGN